MKKNNISFPAMEPFEFEIRRVLTNSQSVNNTFDSHVHRECEIYVNVTGDVSFVVEGRLYPVLPGSAVITRPYEHHHCIYHSEKPHDHFWILFSCDGNEELLEPFFRRGAGENNLRVLSPENTSALLTLCGALTDADPADRENLFRFFRLLSLLRDADTVCPDPVYPKDLIVALSYLERHFSESLTVTQLAEVSHVSINTLERRFAEYFGQSPSAYLRKKRLAHGARLLSEGKTVTEACVGSGFSDCSSFISLFRKTYGITPLRYRKRYQTGR